MAVWLRRLAYVAAIPTVAVVSAAVAGSVMAGVLINRTPTLFVTEGVAIPRRAEIILNTIKGRRTIAVDSMININEREDNEDLRALCNEHKGVSTTAVVVRDLRNRLEKLWQADGAEDDDNMHQQEEKEANKLGLSIVCAKTIDPATSTQKPNSFFRWGLVHVLEEDGASDADGVTRGESVNFKWRMGDHLEFEVAKLREDSMHGLNIKEICTKSAVTIIGQPADRVAEALSGNEEALQAMQDALAEESQKALKK